MRCLGKLRVPSLRLRSSELRGLQSLPPIVPPTQSGFGGLHELRTKFRLGADL